MGCSSQFHVLTNSKYSKSTRMMLRRTGFNDILTYNDIRAYFEPENWPYYIFVFPFYKGFYWKFSEIEIVDALSGIMVWKSD